MIIPAQHPNAGSPAAVSLRSGSRTSKATDSRHSVVDSPPGITRPSTRLSSPARRTGTGSAPTACSARRCSGTSPCRARTPSTGGISPPSKSSRIGTVIIRRQLSTITSAGLTPGGLPAAGGVVLVGGQGIQVDADHGFAQATGDLGHHVRVVVEGGGLHDRGGALGRVAGLENARADEHTLRAELHHQRRVSG